MNWKLIDSWLYQETDEHIVSTWGFYFVASIGKINQNPNRPQIIGSHSCRNAGVEVQRVMVLGGLDIIDYWSLCKEMHPHYYVSGCHRALFSWPILSLLIKTACVPFTILFPRRLHCMRWDNQPLWIYILSYNLVNPTTYNAVRPETISFTLPLCPHYRNKFSFSTKTL